MLRKHLPPQELGVAWLLGRFEKEPLSEFDFCFGSRFFRTPRILRMVVQIIDLPYLTVAYIYQDSLE